MALMSIEGSGKSAQMRWLAWAFDALIHNDEDLKQRLDL